MSALVHTWSSSLHFSFLLFLGELLPLGLRLTLKLIRAPFEIFNLIQLAKTFLPNKVKVTDSMWTCPWRPQSSTTDTFAIWDPLPRPIMLINLLSTLGFLPSLPPQILRDETLLPEPFIATHSPVSFAKCNKGPGRSAESSSYKAVIRQNSSMTAGDMQFENSETLND